MSHVDNATRYEMVRKIAEGGFGVVHEARYIGEGGFSKRVALKLLRVEMQDVAEVASRLRDEARILGHIHHRAIVQVDRLTMHEGGWAVVMEYVEGADLRQILDKMSIPVGPALEIVSEVAGALHAAWCTPGPDGRPLRLIHRDIKPANIRLTPYGEVKVLDFGIARAEFASREAQTGLHIFGTLDYFSPERFDLRDGAASDVYALGVVLAEMLTGEKLRRTSASRKEHEGRLAGWMRQVRAVAPPEVAGLVESMLGWDPNIRPSAGEVESTTLLLRAHVSGGPLRHWAERVVGGVMRGAALSEALEQFAPARATLMEDALPTVAPSKLPPLASSEDQAQTQWVSLRRAVRETDRTEVIGQAEAEHLEPEVLPPVAPERAEPGTAARALPVLLVVIVLLGLSLGLGLGAWYFQSLRAANPQRSSEFVSP